MPTITPLYLGLLAILFFWLSLRVSLLRLKGYSSDESKADVLQRAVRTQANAAEYIPLGILLVLMLELQGAPGGLVHLFGATLLASRLVHFVAFGLLRNRLMLMLSSVVNYIFLLSGGLAILYFALFA